MTTDIARRSLIFVAGHVAFIALAVMISGSE
jgi:hypothetical protein